MKLFINKNYLIHLVILFSLVLLLFIASLAAAENSLVLTGNLLLHSTAADFAGGSMEGTVPGQTGQGAVELAQAGGKYISAGTYTSIPVATAPFQEMIISWNSTTPDGTAVTIEGQVLVDNAWSEWFSWGTWSTSVETGSAATNPKHPYISMETDTLTIKNGKKATAFRYRLTLYSNNPQVTPAVRQVAVSIRDGQNIPKVYPPTPALSDYAQLTKDLAVPTYSQTVRDPNIAARMCSPTSLAMVMRYYGIEKTPEETAWGVMDHVGDMFGNWPFNTAYAASNGLTAYVDFFNSLSDLKREIAQGHPVIAAVSYRNSENVPTSYPVLHNAPIKSTPGHVLVVRGFMQKDGKEYVLVNDPAAPDNNSVYREYLADEFEKAWTKAVYVITPGNVPGPALQRIPAQVAPFGSVREDKDGLYRIFQINTANSPLALGSDNLRCIVMQKPDGKEEFLPVNNDFIRFNAENPAGKYRFIVIGKNHKIYEASLDWPPEKTSKPRR
ncbi:MAG TPA: peptidase C39 family protein [Methylomusa anaerophila]|uniref:Peptidase C39-like domain-containing protein n=1 Tax=Methylomusa anaerophila TaxID=1930071 RepID=A0A348AIU7_9FIRM|nr:peptidase C39 family protein [Methylomusa anaerophila]BBB90995.1 hypothetical protein MAMMFC1_01662 [Methylomusa anaerophila]HML88866.1 peptidase C39 family protein [Methylomusa anaerophila]